MSFLESIIPQHAVVLPKQHNDTSLMTYVKSVSSVIGSSNVLAVFDNGTNVKIYLKSEKHVSLLVNQGLVLHGLYSNAEYAVPRGDKVVLSNVDPTIPDDELVKLLSSYGTLESDLMYKKPFTECEYSHIKSDIRYVYMNIYDKLNFPCKLDWMLNDMWYEIFVTVEEQSKAPSSIVNCTRASDSQLSQKNFARQNINNLGNSLGNSGFCSTPIERNGNVQPQQSLPVINSVAGTKPVASLLGATSNDDSGNDVKPPILRKIKPKTLSKMKPKVFGPQARAGMKPKRVAFFSKNTGNPHPMALKKFLRNTPVEVRSRYPMDCKQLMLFFKQTYKNNHKVEVVFSLLGTSNKDTLVRFKCELEDLSRDMKSIPLTLRINRVLAEIDTYLAGLQE